MIKIVSFLSLILLWCNAISQTSFSFFLKSGFTEDIVLSHEHSDNNYYFLGGISDSIVNGQTSRIFIKSDINGDTISKYIHFPDTTINFYAIKSIGDNLLAIGIYKPIDTGTTIGLYDVVFNSDLEILRKKAFHIPSEYIDFRSISKHLLTDSDGNFILAVSLAEPYFNQRYDAGDLCFYKFNASGDTICSHLTKIEMGQEVYDICFNTDSTQIWIFGYGFQWGVKQLVKFDLDFNLLSIQEVFSEPGIPFNVIQRNSNSWIVCGRFTYPYRVQDDDVKVFEMDSNLDISSTVIIGTQDTLDYPAFRRSVDISPEGDIYISGTHNVTIGFVPDVVSWITLTKLDSNFNHLFTRYYNLDNKYYDNFDIKVVSDGGVILCNQRYDSDNNVDPPLNFDAWVLKVNGDGILTDIPENHNITQVNALVYPNPGSDHLNIVCEWPNAVFRLFSINGKEIFKTELSDYNNEINTSNLNNGIYTWRIEKNKFLIENGKWIKK